MFQDFSNNSEGEKGSERLARLRETMQEHSVTAFLVPHADEHQNEYLPARAERLAWLTGFTGSAGFAIATLETCVLFVDGRYTLQVKDQIDADHFSSENLVDLPPSKWLEQNTGDDDVIGYDPWLITHKQFEAYKKAAKTSGATLKETPNLVDAIWDDQPPSPQGAVSLHAIEQAGKAAADKIAELQNLVAEKDCALTVLTDPASLAWAFNIRGSDVVHNPLPLGFAILPNTGKPLLFMDSAKFSNAVRSEVESICEIHAPETLQTKLAELSPDQSVLCDVDRMAVALTQMIEEAGGKIVRGRDPVILPRAIKNETEIKGARTAHLRDGVAMAKFLCWLDAQKPEDIDEISAAEKLETCRSETAKAFGTELKEISFDTISGHGPNGAIVHYRVTEATNRQFADNSLYLVDSGGQYTDGTTDITRTIAIGTPPPAAVTDFTLVLKGHIAIATARFPKGTRGVDIDVLARQALWQHGKDYMHGTGHGVGSYLNVHEGPQNISKRGMEALVPGMILSNEPGFYVEGQYGIRIENLVLVTELQETPGGNIQTHSFENLTWCPIDTRLVDASLLTTAERDWLNDYHGQVCAKLSPHLQAEETEWLEKVTRAV